MVNLGSNYERKPICVNFGSKHYQRKPVYYRRPLRKPLRVTSADLVKRAKATVLEYSRKSRLEWERKKAIEKGFKRFYLHYQKKKHQPFLNNSNSKNRHLKILKSNDNEINPNRDLYLRRPRYKGTKLNKRYWMQIVNPYQKTLLKENDVDSGRTNDIKWMKNARSKRFLKGLNIFRTIPFSKPGVNQKQQESNSFNENRLTRHGLRFTPYRFRSIRKRHRRALIRSSATLNRSRMVYFDPSSDKGDLLLSGSNGVELFQQESSSKGLSKRFKVILSAVQNNFWAMVLNPDLTSFTNSNNQDHNRLLKLNSAGRFPGTAGSRRSTAYAAERVSEWAAYALKSQLQDEFQSQKSLIDLNSSFMLPFLEKKGALKRTLSVVATATKKTFSYKFSDLLNTLFKAPLIKREVVIVLKNWSREKRWRSALKAFYKALERFRIKIKLQQLVVPILSHNGLRLRKTRRV